MAQLTEEGLSQAELENARLGFFHMLRQRFSPEFVQRYGNDLLARARFELAEAEAKGTKVHHPSGWLITCAMRRAMNQYRDKKRAPDEVNIEAAAAIPSEVDTPEEVALEHDRTEKVQIAVDKLPVEQRMVIELRYFEEMSLREIGGVLDWESTKVKRQHKAALERLQALLRLESIDDLQLEIGLAAWVSLAGAQSAGVHLPPGAEVLADRAAHGFSGAWGRVQELARRLTVGGANEPASAAAASGVARTAGVCGAAVAACLATGVVGPGLGGVALNSSHHSPTPSAARSSQAASSPATTPTSTSEAAEASAKASSGKFKQAGANGHHSTKTAGSGSQSASTSQSPTRQVEEEFSPFAGASGSSSTPSSPSNPAPTRSASAPTSGGSSAVKQVNEEFGAFR